MTPTQLSHCCRYVDTRISGFHPFLLFFLFSLCVSLCLCVSLFVCLYSRSPSFSFAFIHLQAGLEEHRVRLIYKLRLLSDDIHVIDMAEEEAQGLTVEEKQARMVDTAPLHLEARVTKGKELPTFQISNNRVHKTITAVLDYVTGGEMPMELFIELKGFITARWDSNSVIRP